MECSFEKTTGNLSLNVAKVFVRRGKARKSVKRYEICGENFQRESSAHLEYCYQNTAERNALKVLKTVPFKVHRQYTIFDNEKNSQSSPPHVPCSFENTARKLPARIRENFFSFIFKVQKSFSVGDKARTINCKNWMHLPKHCPNVFRLCPKVLLSGTGKKILKKKITRVPSAHQKKLGIFSDKSFSYFGNLSL